MKTIKYILTGITMCSLLFNGTMRINGQTGSLEIRETFSYSEVTENLDPGDRFFRLTENKTPDPGSSYLGSVAPGDTSSLWAYIHGADFMTRINTPVRFAWGMETGDQRVPLYALKKGNEYGQDAGHWEVLKASVEKDRLSGSYSLLLTFGKKDTDQWAKLTGNNLGKDVAILVDGKVCSSPRVAQRITGGKCMISGNFTEGEIRGLKASIEGSIR